jgi:transcriptional regulator with XRE-family HTH domain
MNSEPPLLHIVEVDKNAGPNHLKAWREFREMSQEELAEKVDTTASQISMLESGERGLSAKWLRKLAPALKTTPGHLLDHDPTTIDNDVFDIWMAIDRRDRETALRVLRSFKTGTRDRH